MVTNYHMGACFFLFFFFRSMWMAAMGCKRMLGGVVEMESS